MEKMNAQTRATILYFSSFLFLGSTTAVLGPSLLQLGAQTGSSLDLLSLIFPVRAGAYLLGSWAAGSLYDRGQDHRMLSAGLGVIGLTLFLVPVFKELQYLLLVLAGMGLAMGIVDVGCNLLMMRTRSSNLGPYMNSLHFFYGLGSFAAPLVLAGTLENQGGIQRGYAYLGLASLLVLVQVYRLRLPGSDNPETREINQKAELNSRPYLRIAAVGLFFFFYVGVEVGYGNWLSTFVVRKGLAGETGAAVLTSAFWGSFTLGRLASVPLSNRISPLKHVVIDLLGAAGGLVIILTASQQLRAVWLGTLLLGFSLASIFPIMLSLSKKRLSATGKITSTFFVFGGLGAVVIPWLVGQFVEKNSPRVIPAALLLSTAAAGLFLGLDWYLDFRNNP